MTTHNMNDEMLRGRGTSYFFAGVITCNFTDLSFSFFYFLFFLILRKKRSRKCKKKSREVNEWKAFLSGLLD